MARRPSAQWYFNDWRSNAKLRRCSRAARGDWMDILGVLHDEDEYGIARYPLKELAHAAGVPMSGIKELVAKGVLKGSDTRLEKPYTYTPKSGRKEGETVSLIPTQAGPIWFSSRLVKDEHIRTMRGSGASPKHAPKYSPKPTIGEGIGPRAPAQSSSSSSSTSLDDDDTRARSDHLFSRFLEILRLRLQDDPARFNWKRQMGELVRDGFTDAQIFAGIEIARVKGVPKMEYVVSCVRNPPRHVATGPPQNGKAERLDDAQMGKRILGEEYELPSSLRRDNNPDAEGVRAASAPETAGRG